MGPGDRDIKTVSKVITSVPANNNLGLGAVPSSMKRWVTFLKITNENAAANAIWLCSGTTATDAASGVAKDKQYLGNQYDAFAYPDSPRPDAPLFSIAGGKYLTGFTTVGNMHLFLQYFDE